MLMLSGYMDGNAKEFSSKPSAIQMRKYYQSLEGEKKDKFIRKMTEYKKKKYHADEDYRRKVCESVKAKYEDKVKTNPKVMERRRIIAFVHLLNIKHKANVTIKQSKKFDEYEIFFDDALNMYLSKTLICGNQQEQQKEHS